MSSKRGAWGGGERVRLCAAHGPHDLSGPRSHSAASTACALFTLFAHQRRRCADGICLGGDPRTASARRHAGKCFRVECVCVCACVCTICSHATVYSARVNARARAVCFGLNACELNGWAPEHPKTHYPHICCILIVFEMRFFVGFHKQKKAKLFDYAANRIRNAICKYNHTKYRNHKKQTHTHLNP